jgi:hypothetical protein
MIMVAYALVENGTTVIDPIFGGALPQWITLPNGDHVSGLHEGVITTDGVYSILPVQYDAQPANSQEIGRSYSVTDGIVQVARTWEAVPVSVPPQITNAQTRQWLVAAGLFDAVNAAIQAMGGATLIKWEYANIILRSDPLIAQLGAQLGKTSADMNQMFIEASAL